VAVIVLPGHAGNTYFALDDAEIVAKAGYSTLLFEHRTCADSSLAATTGLMEAQDVLGAVDYLKSRSDVSYVATMGFSEGGTSTLLAAAQEPDIDAVLAMGGYDSLKNDLLDPDEDLHPLIRIERVLIMWAMEIQMGKPVEASSPVDTIAQISPRPLLLIYGEYEAKPGQALFDAAAEPKEIWFVPGTGHGGYQHVEPEEYPLRVTEFFNRVFPSSP
jgi:dienelactone hydrolase